MTDLVATLRKVLQGEVKEDQMSQHIYSVDASLFEVMPQLVVIPKNEEDIQEVIRQTSPSSIPIIPRGGATGIAGGCLGNGIVVDTSKYFKRILDFNPDEKWIVCEPGVTQDELNAFVLPYGLRLGPETSTSNRATIGGMCAANAAGSHFLKFGNMLDHVLAVELVFSNGEKRWIGKEHPFLPLQHLQKELKNQIEPTFHRSSSGYLISSFLDEPFNPAKILVGSEGTLGLFTKLKLGLSPLLAHTSLVLFPFSSIELALDKVEEILAFNPLSLELLDHHILSFGKLSTSLKNSLDWLSMAPEALLIAEFENEIPSIFSKQKILSLENQKKSFWALRKGGLGLLLSRRSYSRAIAFIEDLAIPPRALPSFMKELKGLIPRDMGVYGHAGDGCLHIRPFVDLRNPKEKEWMFDRMEKISALVRAYNGSLTGEHGDGLIRSWLNPQFFGKETIVIFKKIKQIFDPLNLMNPGKIVEGKKPAELLRKNLDRPYATFLSFEKEGGFSLSVDLCNGNGECRKKTTLMCPSFHAYGDERHTTRARAQALRAVLKEEADLDKGVLDVLDYCLECKGCKTECPSNVDMAKMKAEMLFQYQEEHGYFFLTTLFGNLPSFSKMASRAPLLANWILDSSLTKQLLSFCGVAKERPFPKLAKRRFSQWCKKKPNKRGSKPITLFNDTFTEYYAPEIGIAAVEVLEKCGYSVQVLPFTCCGRPYISKGLLKKAKESAFLTIQVLNKAHGPIIVLEPSCLSAIQDDYEGLLGGIRSDVHSLEEFLPYIKEVKQDTVYFHPHCHEQALGNPKDLLTPLFPKNHIQYSTAGCCGLAGSFGYEQRHYPMSMAIGEKILFPEIRSLPQGTTIVASGFSCRSQIEHGTSKKAFHLAEYYRSLLMNH